MSARGLRILLTGGFWFLGRRSKVHGAPWERIGGYDEGMLEGYEDWDFHIRLGLIGTCGRRIARPVLWYRQRPNSMRQVLEEDDQKRARVLDYLRKKHHNIYSGERPVGCCGQPDLPMHGWTPKGTVLLRYTGNKVADQVLFVKSHRYTFSASNREFSVVEDDVAELMKTQWFEVV